MKGKKSVVGFSS